MPDLHRKLGEKLKQTYESQNILLFAERYSLS